jgi:hypothetical protein
LSCLLFFGCKQEKASIGLEELLTQLQIDNPKHGFVSLRPARTWEESLISGNGTIGVLIPGDINKDRIVLSHERIFLPRSAPLKGPALGNILDETRQGLLEGNFDAAADLFIKESAKAGFTQEFVWTNPHIPACELEFESLRPIDPETYARTVNYETGEATVAYRDEEVIIHREAFVSRDNNLAVIRFSSPSKAKLSYKFRLSELPLNDSDVDNTDEEFRYNPKEFIESLDIHAENDLLSYHAKFKVKWKGSLEAYSVLVKIIPTSGAVMLNDEWIHVEDADEILMLASIDLHYESEIHSQEKLEELLNQVEPDYYRLLAPHKHIHGEMFNRFSFSLGNEKELNLSSEELLASSSFENFNKELLVQLMKACRYNNICSTGELPPTLQGIWGGTWMPKWSGDFTLNGNVPSAIASGLNGNFPEITSAYLNLMISWYEDFKLNAKDLYGMEGIYIPSRGSDMGNCYTFNIEYPMLYWWAGSAWASNYFFDYWQYTGDEDLLVSEGIPFMLDAYKFLKQVLFKHEGQYIFIPSYSPEIAPQGKHPIAINATMDIAVMKQLLRNLMVLAEKGFIDNVEVGEYEEILENLPDYAIDKNKELKEWIWDGLDNDNMHRHASHLYPLFDGIDPEFKENNHLRQAAKQAIESRLEYRRDINGGEMAFGLVQLGTAAAHLKDVEHAHECLKWLSSSYWTPAFVSYHDPGNTFNLDISGGMPAVLIYMLVQSTLGEIELLPAWPDEWPNGEIKGVLARGGIELDMKWENGIPVHVHVKSHSGKKTTIRFKEKVLLVDLEKGKSLDLDFRDL